MNYVLSTAVLKAPAAVDVALSRRGLAGIFFAICAALTLAGWLRPTLSSDIRAIHIPLGVLSAEGAEPETILRGPRSIPPDSLGMVLLTMILVCTLAVLIAPRWLGKAAGVLLAAALAGNAAAALNHPALIEMLDYEYEQRQQMARMVGATDDDVMADGTNGRVGLRGIPVGDEQRGDPMRGWLYLLYGRWLVLWAAIGIFLGCEGPLRRRWGVFTIASLLGTVTAVAVCAPRLRAEYCWARALHHEQAGRYVDARQALTTAVATFPAFARLERTWLLAGKLDCHEGKHTPVAQFFAAYQLARDKQAPRGISLGQDLPWVIAGTRDYRSGLAATPSGFNLSVAADAGRPGTPGFTQTARRVPQSLRPDYNYARSREPRLAAAILEKLLEQDGMDQPCVRSQAARLAVTSGLTLYCRGPAVIDSQPWLDRRTQNVHLTAALDAWQRASVLDPGRRDCAVYQAAVQARLQSGTPLEVERGFQEGLSGLADHVLHAEALNIIGDAYFTAGDFTTARQIYSRSYDVFCLPKFINLRAQRRLGGL
jgi:tetratricopeptide (TPR) repeat protein